MLEELVYNLVENAIRYNVDGGKVSVSVINNESEITLVVRDTGIGIPESAQGRIFERFLELINPVPSKQEEQDSVLQSLSTVQNIWVVQLSWKAKENEGTTVTVILPKKINFIAVKTFCVKM